jgi:hypothetical protein
MSTPAAPVRLLRLLWRAVLATAITLFVLWNLFFQIFRNPLDLWWTDDQPYRDDVKKLPAWSKVEPCFDTAYGYTRAYGNLGGIQQGWSMFTPNLARRSGFMAARLVFDDDSDDLVYSENEFDFARPYVRLGGWRQRKVEDELVSDSAKKLAGAEGALYEAYARWCVRKWRAANPDDPRQGRIKEVRLIRRNVRFPRPGDAPRHFDEPDTVLLGTFDPDTGKKR